MEEKTKDVNSDVLSFDEAMNVLHVKRTTMYKLMQQHDPPNFVKIGAKRIITRKSLLDWVERHEGDIIF